jgi:hypothetical protein
MNRKALDLINHGHKSNCSCTKKTSRKNRFLLS